MTPSIGSRIMRRTVNATLFFVLAFLLSLTTAKAQDFEATLAGINEVQPVITNASGNATITLDGDELVVEGSFDNLSATMANPAGTPAHIHLGGLDVNGSIAIALVVAADEDSLGCSFETGANMFDLTTLSYPAG